MPAVKNIGFYLRRWLAVLITCVALPRPGLGHEQVPPLVRGKEGAVFQSYCQPMQDSCNGPLGVFHHGTYLRDGFFYSRSMEDLWREAAPLIDKFIQEVKPPIVETPSRDGFPGQFPPQRSLNYDMFLISVDPLILVATAPKHQRDGRGGYSFENGTKIVSIWRNENGVYEECQKNPAIARTFACQPNSAVDLLLTRIVPRADGTYVITQDAPVTTLAGASIRTAGREFHVRAADTAGCWTIATALNP